VADASQLLGTRHRRARLAYRDVASATNRVTLIAALLPAGCVSTHTLFCLKTPLTRREQYFLCGLFNSLVVNYLVRLRVTTHVTTAIVERLPVPLRGAAPRAFEEIAAIARLLSRGPQRATAERRGGSGADRLAAGSRDTHAVAALNARVAQLYRLSKEEFAHVLDTFPLVARDERDRALVEFSRITL
jgi:hypothetical protein